ncbi:aldehyde dehydrogenase family protein [Virgibacillus proomii]|uniref:aldehyde dehydrogenase family protein n=1 Tax=Virgibacillus proomii TaxID=84407 RepID=UPI0035A0B67F
MDPGETIKLGNGMNSDAEIGPLVSKEQFDRILNYIQIGKRMASPHSWRRKNIFVLNFRSLKVH